MTNCLYCTNEATAPRWPVCHEPKCLNQYRATRFAVDPDEQPHPRGWNLTSKGMRP